MSSSFDRRDFLRILGTAGALAAVSPWMSAFAQVDKTVGETVRIGVIGPGSRGQFLMSFILKNPKAKIVAVCDVYQPSLDAALKMVPDAVVYDDYRKLL